MMRNIYCFNAISKYGTDRLTADYALTDDLARAEGVLVRSAALHETEFGDSLLAIARAGAGVNNIPLDRCANEGIVVFNTPGANANGVKELVIAGLLLAARDVVGGIEWCKENKEDANIAKTVEKAKKAFAGYEIKGKKLGVIGLGAIGAEVANTAAALGMEVYGYDPYISINAAWALSRDVKHITSVDTIYQECDYITVHVPLLDSTRGMINGQTIGQMKDDVVVLNFARDLLVDDDAMAAALETGKVRRYVTDFPNPKSVAMKNVIAIPHLGASTPEAEDNCAVMAAQEISDYLKNGNITHSVNMPEVHQPRAGGKRICIIHKNEPGMISQITALTTEAGLNIENMVNKSKKNMAYTMLDATGAVDARLSERLSSIPAVIRVRIL